MSDLKNVTVKELHLDLFNYRTRPQKTEVDAVKAMVNVKPERFWPILESILESGYIPTENIIVLVDKKGKKIVKEGNRRIASIKLILGQIKLPDGVIPTNISDAIVNTAPTLKKQLAKVPCLVFQPNESDVVDDIVARTHGKGEAAARDKWTSVATARHNRDAKDKPEPALDVLECFLTDSVLITGIQREQWSGDYPITVLHELLRRIAIEKDFAKVSDVASLYVDGELAPQFEELIFEIGQEALGFNDLRTIDGWKEILSRLGISPKASLAAPSATQGSASKGNTGGTFAKSSASKKTAMTKQPRRAVALDDPKYIATLLKRLVIYGEGREKIATLKKEAELLNLDKHPFSFCFTFRSILELSVRAYCKDNGIALTEVPKGDTRRVEKKLVKLCREAKDDIVKNLPDDGRKKDMVKALHGAFAELSNPESFLSVNSLNQLLHSTTLMTSGKHIATVFANVFPLIQQLNAIN
jgi:hypothetical protein